MSLAELPSRKVEQYAYLSSWDAPEKKDKLIADGYEKCEWCNATWVKIEYAPAYSTQVPNRHIGSEPEPVGGQSVHSHRYYTHYYEVKRAHYDAMEFKPTLTKQHRPLRLHNFDGFVEVTQEEHSGLGWSEIEQSYDQTTRYVFFVTD